MSGTARPPFATSLHRGLGTAVATFLPLAALAGFALLAALSAVKTTDEARLQAAARALAASVDARLGTTIATLRILAVSHALEDEAAPRQAMAAFHEISAELGGPILLMGPQSDRVLPSAPHGSVVETLPPRRVQELATALREQLARVVASGQPIVSDLIAASADGHPIVAVMVPVLRDGATRDALALILEPTALQTLLAHAEVSDGIFAAIGDSRLRLVAHSDDPLSRRVGTAAPNWMATAMQERAQGLVARTSTEGRDRVYAFTRPRIAPDWTVAVSESAGQQRARARQVLQWMLAGCAALALGLAAAVWASRREAIRDARREADLLRTGRAEVLRLLGGLPAVIFHREMRRDGSSRLLYRGGDFEGVTGWPATDLTSEDALRRHAYPGDTRLADIAEALWQDGQVRYEWRMLQPDGGVRWLSTLVRVLQRRGDDHMEIIGYSLNITAEQDAKARALGAAKLAALGEMAAGLAHELKQPLQSMSLAAEIGLLAAARHDHAEIRRRFATIVGQAQRASYLIERLRRFSSGAGTRLATEDVPLATAVEGALLLTGSALSNAGVTVEVALGEPAPVVRGEAVLLEQVLTNLLLNAADAMAAQPAGAPRRIRIAAESAADGMVRITVADTGGGIPADILARIFEPFVTTKGPDKGTGLGLSICHGLITGMGGTIEARNAAAGAVFVVTLAAAGAPQRS